MKATVYNGKALDILRTLPDASVHCCVTSPPYYGLRDYGEDDQLGLEDSPEAYVDRLVGILREVRRVLRDDGTLWLNLGDSYAGSWGNYGGQNRGKADGQRKITTGSQIDNPAHRGTEQMRPPTSNPHDVLKPKDLIGIPWRVAFALQADGWWLRQDIIWHKGNPMPESVTDRCTKAHEYIFLLTKSKRYFYDHEAIKEESDAEPGRSPRQFGATSPAGTLRNDVGRVFVDSGKRNRRSVWQVNTSPFPGAHFAVYPPDLIAPCVMAGTSAKGCCASCGAPYKRDIKREANYTTRQDRDQPDWKGPQVDSLGWAPATVTDNGWKAGCDCNADATPCTVLDPFSGSGTTGLVAIDKHCNYIGIELSHEYAEMSRRRLSAVTLPLFTETAA